MVSIQLASAARSSFRASAWRAPASAVEGARSGAGAAGAAGLSVTAAGAVAEGGGLERR